MHDVVRQKPGIPIGIPSVCRYGLIYKNVESANCRKSGRPKFGIFDAEDGPLILERSKELAKQMGITGSNKSRMVGMLQEKRWHRTKKSEEVQAKIENLLKILPKPRSRTVASNGNTECRSV
ncbi:hypothetical protein TNCV_154511 [Trichonephila clavipes]|uniref:Uncharacterized protein n=1 Tax=Trichonephila clavipes TaxID=2585209 RepID=A0A8X7BKU6_TRICX|nr:hypothetical protein TNCV_154511 [Trichonephila clavipes]